MVVETFRQQVVLRAALQGKYRDLLVTHPAEDQEGCGGGGAEQLVESFDSLAIGEEEVDDDRSEPFTPAGTQSVQCVIASTHRFDVEWAVASDGEQLSYGNALDGIGKNEQ